MTVIPLPNGFYNPSATIFYNLEIGKSQPERKGKVINCGRIMVNTMTKTLVKVIFSNDTFAWDIIN